MIPAVAWVMEFGKFPNDQHVFRLIWWKRLQILGYFIVWIFKHRKWQVGVFQSLFYFKGQEYIAYNHFIKDFKKSIRNDFYYKNALEMIFTIKMHWKWFLL